MSEQGPPDVYTDSLGLMVTPFGIVIDVQQRAPVQGTEKPKTVAYVRMSLEHAKVLAIQLRKILKSHEDQQGSPIILHPQLYTQMGISREEDW
jgi:hypothetical protein